MYGYMTQDAQRKLDEAKLKFERALPGHFDASDETENGELEGQADALTELTEIETDKLEAPKMDPETDTEFDNALAPKTDAEFKDADGPDVPNLAKADEAPKANATADDKADTAEFKDADGPDVPNLAKADEAPKANAPADDKADTAEFKDADGPDVPNLAKADEAPKA
ncbi:hypothetical protein D6T63_17500 [Arthrobacter cheniae]|uniref:Uncharacterized protein n=2 Tax=Arthrobacter cheniae TaxID=1258888 RepID=A0A3A5LX64_9MICC|nr:hypothetical protein D6T63_17500 [Arthrobacter cheniae]